MELWRVDADGETRIWESDGGVATYHPMQLEAQMLVIDDGVTDGTVCFSWPLGTGGSDPCFAHDALAADVKVSLEAGWGVSMDVEYNSADKTYIYAFTDRLGDLPLSTPLVGGLTGGSAQVLPYADGSAEVQAITLSGDTATVYEIQSIQVIDVDGVGLGNYYTLTLPGELGVVQINTGSTAGEIELAIESGLDSIVDVDVQVEVLSSTSESILVTIVDPVGDMDAFVADSSGLAASGGSASVVKVVKGRTSSDGTFTVSMNGEYTVDISAGASSGEVKEALESLSMITSVDVTREDTGTGFRWWVTFTGDVGDLPLLEAYPYRWETQQVELMGGSPTPLGGTFTLSVFAGEGAVSETTNPLPYDVTASTVKAALESLPGLGRVNVVQVAGTNGRSTILVTFRDAVGDIPLLEVDYSGLTGSNAEIIVTEVIAGSDASLIGDNPRLTVVEMIAGLPRYTATYTPVYTGLYEVSTYQLLNGGLRAEYFDNAWLMGTPTLERVDNQVSFDWGVGAVTTYARDCVSVRWTGKFLSPSTENFTLIIRCDDSSRLFIDHELIIDAWDASGLGEYRATFGLTFSVYHDLVLEYKEEIDAASIQLLWYSHSVAPSIIPSEALWYSSPIVGSPWLVSIISGATSFPWTDAKGDGLEFAVAGVPAEFYIQAKDSLGNNETTDISAEDGRSFVVYLIGPSGITLGASTTGSIKYVGDGQYHVSYTASKAGEYYLHIQTAEGVDIYCGKGQESKCSPFGVTVAPRPPVASMSEAQANYQSGWDSLAEGIAGQTGYFGIQLRDAYGNNAGTTAANSSSSQEEIGVSITSTQDGSTYKGAVQYNGYGFYTIIYTVPHSGDYSLSVTLGGEGMWLCTPPPSSSPQDRYYDGISPYYPDAACSLGSASLSIIHGMLHIPSSTADASLACVSGELEQLTIYSRDSFSNIRTGDSTSNLDGGGDGFSDVFFATFTGPQGHVVKSSSAVVELTFDGDGWIRLSFADGSVASRDLYVDLSATTADNVAAALLPIESIVTSLLPSIPGTLLFRVTFLSHLDSYASTLLHKLNVILPRLDHSESSSGSSSGAGSVTVLATGGSYPVYYTLWNKGMYSLDLKGAGRVDFSDQHIEGSSFFVSVSGAQTEAASSSLVLPNEADIKAGTQQKAIIHARDARLRDIQVVGAIMPDVQSIIPETQTIDFTGSPGDDLTISFLGQDTAVTLGTTTALQLETALNGFWGVGRVGWSGSVLVSGIIENGANVAIQFLGEQLSGNLPYLTTSGTASAMVSKTVEGVGFLRREMQYLRCSPSAGTFDLTWRGLTVSVSASDTIEDTEDALTSGWGAVVSISGVDESAFCTDDLIFITFKEEIGDVPSVLSTPSNAIDLVGSLNGEAPYWGYLSLSIDGGNTFTSQPIDAHSSSVDVESALEALGGVENVIVSRTLLDDTVALWTITFEGLVGEVAPAIIVDDSGIAWPSGFTPPSFVSVLITMGTIGNAQDSSTSDLYLSSIDFELTDAALSSPLYGLVDVQSITCAVLDISSADSATIKLMWPVQMDNSNILETGASPRVALANHDTPLPDLQTILRQLTGDDGLVVSSSDLVLFCSTTGGGESVTVTFSTQLGFTQPLVGVSSSDTSIVTVTSNEITSGIDDIHYLGDGIYEILFTPIKEGTYSISASIASGTIPFSDDTVRVVPSSVDAVRSSFTAPSLVTQGITDYILIQASDAYENDLNGEAEGMFWLSIVGATTTTDNTTTTIDVLAESSFSPNTDGSYTAPVTLQAAGKYTAFVRYHSPGGLLTIFFSTTDFNDAALADAVAVANFPFHDPPHCLKDGSMILGCDSTCTSPVISFNWGISSPHPELGLPADYFSALFEGFVKAPISGPVTFTLLADDSARLLLNGEEIIATTNSAATNSSESAVVDMTEGDLVPVLLEMVEILDNATVELHWMYDGLTVPTLIPADALYYSRNLMGSPTIISNVPGKPVAEKSSITDSMATQEYVLCVAMELCGVTIQARDEAGNDVNNSGSHGDWIVSIDGIGGWALDGRYDEVVSGIPVSVDSTVDSMDWSGTSLSTVTCQMGSSVCVVSLDLGLNRGDEIVIGRERHVVSSFDVDMLALALVEPFHEADGDFAVYLVDPLTGSYGVTFTPTIIGGYTLRVQAPPSSEVQIVRTSLDGVGGTIGGSFVVCRSFGGEETCSSDVPFNADATQVSTAIEEVYGIGSAIQTVAEGTDCTVGCSWTVEFDAVLGDIEDVIIDAAGLTGLGAKVEVETITPGRNQVDIMGSPITVSVSPNYGNAARTMAYRKGLYTAIAGEMASFVVQVKDEAGNNGWTDSDALAAYLIPPGKAEYVKCYVKPLEDGLYNMSYIPTVSGDHILAIYLSTASEVQEINLRMMEAGSFTIFLGPGSTDTTPSIAFDAPASSIAEALSALSYGSVKVTSSVSQDVVTHTITFVDSVGDVPQSEVIISTATVEANPSASTDSSTIVKGQASHIRTFSSPIIAESQLLSVSASEDGTFSLSYRGRETPDIDVGASGAEVKAALESLDVIGTVSINEISVGIYDGAYSITFQPEVVDSFLFG